MNYFRMIYYVLAIATVCFFVGYTLVTHQMQKKHPVQNQAPMNGNSPQANQYYPPNQILSQFNLNDAFSIQKLSDGRLIALLPVQGGAAWFVIGEAPIAQMETDGFSRR